MKLSKKAIQIVGSLGGLIIVITIILLSKSCYFHRWHREEGTDWKELGIKNTYLEWKIKDKSTIVWKTDLINTTDQEKDMFIVFELLDDTGYVIGRDIYNMGIPIPSTLDPKIFSLDPKTLDLLEKPLFSNERRVITSKIDVNENLISSAYRGTLKLNEQFIELKKNLTKFNKSLEEEKEQQEKERRKEEKRQEELKQKRELWLDNWKKLKLNMTEFEVKNLLGNPEGVSNSTFSSSWDYPDFGHVNFEKKLLDEDGPYLLKSWDAPSK